MQLKSIIPRKFNICTLVTRSFSLRRDNPFGDKCVAGKRNVLIREKRDLHFPRTWLELASVLCVYIIKLSYSYAERNGFFFKNRIKCVFQMEQMDLEVREIPIQSRAMYNSRLKSYKQEVEKLEKDFVSTRTRLLLSSPIANLEILPVTCLAKPSFRLQMPIFFTAEYCNCIRRMWLLACCHPLKPCVRPTVCSPSDKLGDALVRSARLKLSLSHPPRSSHALSASADAVLRVCVYTCKSLSRAARVCVCFRRTWPRLVIHKSWHCLAWSLASIKA